MVATNLFATPQAFTPRNEHCLLAAISAGHFFVFFFVFAVLSRINCMFSLFYKGIRSTILHVFYIVNRNIVFNMV